MEVTYLKEANQGLEADKKSLKEDKATLYQQIQRQEETILRFTYLLAAPNNRTSEPVTAEANSHAQEAETTAPPQTEDSTVIDTVAVEDPKPKPEEAEKVAEDKTPDTQRPLPAPSDKTAQEKTRHTKSVSLLKRIFRW